MPLPPAHPRLLGTWNQVAMRAYVRQVFCFPLDDAFNDFSALHDRIRRALSLAAAHFPHFAGRVHLGSDPKGKVYVSTPSDDSVSLDIFDHRGTRSFAWTYSELRSQGFPAKAFVGPLFSLPYELAEDGPGVPVTEVHARIIQGGLLLCVYMHHSISDGIGMHDFVSTMAAYTMASEGTRVDFGHDADIDIDIPVSKTTRLVQDLPFEKLVTNCPEYLLLPEPTGPTASPSFRHASRPPLDHVPKTGRIFRFSLDNIARLRGMAKKCETLAGEEQTHLLTPASWRRRALKETLDGYASNAVCMARITARLDNHFAVVADLSAPWPPPSPTAALGQLILSIDVALANIDDDFVATRTAMFRAASDVRLVGLNLDPHDPHDFIVNSWRHLGADVEFDLPGVIKSHPSGSEAGASADAVRRAQPEWNMGAGLILPGKKGSGYDVLVTLDQASMGRLLSDRAWRSWVSETME